MDKDLTATCKIVHVLSGENKKYLVQNVIKQPKQKIRD